MPGPLDDALAGAPRTDRYEIRERIGEGSMGLVFRAYDHEMGSEVALKTLRDPNPEDLRRLKKEFRELADLTHPNLAQLYLLDTNAPPYFFTMELIHGVDFVEFVRGDGLCYERLRVALDQLARGLCALHAEGKRHRDVKPSNILVEPDGRSVLLDFGLVTSAEGSRAGSGLLAGTPAYMAPEQAWGLDDSPLSDWFGVGAVLYEALTGRLPFGEAGILGSVDPSVRPARCRDVVAETPPDLDDLVLSLLHTRPEDRPTVSEILKRVRPDAPPPIRREVSGLVGRTREHTDLNRAFNAAQKSGEMVRVTGPSGIGKTALIEHFAEEIEAKADALVLRSRCHPQESVPFKTVDAIIDGLSQYLAEETDDDLLARTPPHLPALLRVFPVLGTVRFSLMDPQPDFEDFDPAEVRRLAFASLRALLARTAERQPVVLWIDDLQWGDEDSVPLLQELLRPPRPPGLLLVLSYRSEETARSAMLAALEPAGPSRLPGWERHIALGALSHDESCELIRRHLGADAERFADRVDDLARECTGSPYFAEELARMLASEPSDARLLVEGLVRRRLDELAPAARQLLEIVSVAGRSLDRSLALEAAGLGEAQRPLVATLQQDCLVRLTSLAGRPAVETYHDRIRAGVIEQLADEPLRQRHRALAATLERTPEPDPETLALHFHGAGEVERAGGYALAAAERADEALAFARAAKLFGQALAWRPGEEAERRGIRVRMAEALVNAGHSAQAAPVFLEAARGGEAIASRDLRRRAVEALLVSGRIDEGIEGLRPLLAELELHLPRDGRTSTLWTACRLAQIAARGRRWQSRTESEVDPRTLARIDLCYSAARGLLSVDTVRGSYLPCLGLLLALRSGEPSRIGHALAAVGGAVLSPTAFRGWGRRMLDEALQIGRALDDPHLLAVTAVALGQYCVVNGDWQGAIDHSNEALAILHERCRGVSWECTVAHTGLLRGLEERGRLRDAGQKARALRDQALAAGDLYGEMTAALFSGVADLAAGEVARARGELGRAMARWSQEGFHVQHLYGLRIEMLADLYEGEAASAWRRLERDWPKLEGSVLLRVPITRIDSHWLRARTALALAIESPAAAKRHLSRVRGDARRLARAGRMDTDAHAASLGAAVAAVEGRSDAALSQLEAAARGYQLAGMTLQDACTRRRKGELVGGDAGANLVARADERLRAGGVADPARFSQIQLPWPGRTLHA